MIVGIHQPNYLPWLGYFRKISMCDVFVFFDNALLPLGKSFVSRNAIKTSGGRQWLTVPIRKEQVPIAEVTIVGDHWIRKHRATLEGAYAHSPWRSMIGEVLAPVLAAEHATIGGLNTALVTALAAYMELGNVRFVRASEMALDATGAASIEEILRRLGARCYVTGRGAGTQRSIDPESLHRQGIEVRYLPDAYRTYRQFHNGFEPNLSAIDALLCCGPQETREILRGT